MTSGQRFKGKVVSHTDIWQKSVPDRGTACTKGLRWVTDDSERQQGLCFDYNDQGERTENKKRGQIGSGRELLLGLWDLSDGNGGGGGALEVLTWLDLLKEILWLLCWEYSEDAGGGRGKEWKYWKPGGLPGDYCIRQGKGDGALGPVLSHPNNVSAVPVRFSAVCSAGTRLASHFLRWHNIIFESCCSTHKFAEPFISSYNQTLFPGLRLQCSSISFLHSVSIIKALFTIMLFSVFTFRLSSSLQKLSLNLFVLMLPLPPLNFQTHKNPTYSYIFHYFRFVLYVP